MKLFVIIFIVASVFADFSQALVAGKVFGTNCQSESYCQDTDFHQDSTKNHHDETHKSESCHQGHSHLVVESNPIVLGTISPTSLKLSFLQFNVSKVQNYHSIIIRPPIA